MNYDYFLIMKFLISGISIHRKWEHVAEVVLSALAGRIHLAAWARARDKNAAQSVASIAGTASNRNSLFHISFAAAH